MSIRILHGVDSLGRAYVSRKKDRACAQCGGQIRRTGSTVKYCCHACYATAAKGKPVAPEVLAARQPLRGEAHQHWRGDAISKKGGRKRALKMYPAIGPCIRCAAEKAERHHKDGNTVNNAPDNIEALCRRCHMEEDGRMVSLRTNPGRGSACR